MKRSLLYQMNTRDAQGLDRVVDEVCWAEDLGIHGVWCLPEAGETGDFRLGAPEFWLAALAGRTEHIRLGWGLAGLMPPDRPPIRSAEQAASLDLVSNGRLEIALLPSAGDPADEVEDWDEGIRMLVEMWDRPRFSWTSDRFEVPPVDVLPKPAQSPHPPLWFVGWSEAHARRAGTAGLGFLDVSGGVDEALEMHRDAYAAARSEADPHDLVCASAYAVALAGNLNAIGVDRLEGWASKGFDEALLSVGAFDETADAARARIRQFAGEGEGVH